MSRWSSFYLAMPLLAALLPTASIGAPPAPVDKAPVDKAVVMQELLAQIHKLGTDARSADPAEYAKLLATDYTEFDPYYAFMLDLPREEIVRLQQVWDKYDKLPPMQRAAKTTQLQVYGNVAILTTTSYHEGQAIPAGPMSNARSMIIYVKQNGQWILTHCHDGRVAGPDGIPVE